MKETPRGPDQGRRRPETVASIGAFDLDDFHAEIGQHLSAEGFGKKRCEIDHSNTFQGLRHFSSLCKCRDILPGEKRFTFP